jgi:hypothetical protein
MKQIKTTLGFLFIALSIISFSSCSKYEEGPGISLRSRKSRVIGEWVTTEIKYSGIDAMSETYSDIFFCSSGSSFNFTNTATYSLDWNFEKEGNSSIVTNTAIHELDFIASDAQCSPIYLNSNDPSSETFTWEFSSNDENIDITYSDGSIESWRIIELRETEMKLKLDDGVDYIEVTLEKK